LLRKGRRIAIDVGKARIGLATSDFHAILASPLVTLKRLATTAETASNTLKAISDLDEILEIYIGLPTNLKGSVTASTTDAITFAEEIANQTAVPVYLMDERMTTSLANSQLREIGRSQREARSTIDQMAAVAILEYALSREKQTGQLPGLLISDWKAEHE
jgi:putative Holliday junction resolvase